MSQICAEYKTTYRSEKPKDCGEMAVYAFIDGVTVLHYHLGRNIHQWKWMFIHEKVYPSLPFARIPVIGSLFKRNVRTGGNRNTVNFSKSFNQRSHLVPGAYEPWFSGEASANLRFVADLSNMRGWYSVDTVRFMF